MALPSNIEHMLQVALASKDGGTQVFRALGGGAAAAASSVPGVGASDAPAARTTTLRFSNTPVTLTHSAGSCNLGLKVLDFPEGVINFLGAVANLTIVVNPGVGVADGAALIAAVGSIVNAADGTLTATEADIIPSTPATLAVRTGTFKGKSTTPMTKDGTTLAVDAYLNLACPGTANVTAVITGTLSITWIFLGDIP